MARLVALSDITGAVAGSMLDAAWPDPTAAELHVVLGVTAAAASRRLGVRVSHLASGELTGSAVDVPDVCVPVVVSDERRNAGHLHLAHSGAGTPTVVDRLVLEFLAGHAVDLATARGGGDPSAALVDQLRSELASARTDAEHLTSALESNRRIGMAMGILIAALRITPEEAFDRLRSASQNSNRKLRDIADDLTHTGDVSVLIRPSEPRASETKRP